MGNSCCCFNNIFSQSVEESIKFEEEITKVKICAQLKEVEKVFAPKNRGLPKEMGREEGGGGLKNREQWDGRWIKAPDLVPLEEREEGGKIGGAGDSCVLASHFCKNCHIEKNEFQIQYR